MRSATGVKKTNLSAQVQPRGCRGREQNRLKVKEEIGDVAGGVSGVCGVPGIVVLGSILGSGGMERGATGRSVTCSFALGKTRQKKVI